jgi:hypothetical protein
MDRHLRNSNVSIEFKRWSSTTSKPSSAPSKSKTASPSCRETPCRPKCGAASWCGGNREAGNVAPARHPAQAQPPALARAAGIHHLLQKGIAAAESEKPELDTACEKTARDFSQCKSSPSAAVLCLKSRHEPAANIGIIGGSGLYQIEGLTSPTEHKIKTPFGKPSDVIFGGKLAGGRFIFCHVTRAATAFCRTS